MKKKGGSFSNAIVRTPCLRLNEGLTTASLGKPIYEKAILQHQQYISALESCGVHVTILEADNNFPDSTFVEDVAVLTEKCAIITNPGAPSRKGEEERVKKVLEHDFYSTIEQIKLPGTLEGGDILRCEDHFYIGLSSRTNEEGAKQLIAILEKYGYTGSVVKLTKMLHLKTGIAYLGNNTCIAMGELVEHPAFQKYRIIKIEDDEDYAANAIAVNGTILLPAGFPKARDAITKAGFPVLLVDTSEFRKVDGGLSCLSLRFLL